MSAMIEMQRIAPERLHTFLRPRSIALVGATDNSRWSISTFENLKRFNFSGPIYLIHPKHEIVHGERTLKSLRDLPEPADLVFIMVPTQSVLSVVQEAAAMGTKQFVILTAGFSEVGIEGAKLEHDLITFAKEHDLIILGPNGNGFINVTNQIVPYGLALSPPLVPGSVGVVLQSGALASAVIAFAQAHAIGLSLLVSMGNESILSMIDVVDYLLDDEATHTIALFLESIREPEELRRIAAKARERHKPIIALKIGRSEISARSALAHTGALVGNDIINDAALSQLGIIRVHSLEDLLVTAGLASSTGILPGRRMGVVSPSGGACDIISDLAEERNITLPNFAPETIAKLQAVLPSFSTIHNPLDVTGYVVVDGTLQRRALEVIGNDPNIDFALYLTTIEGSSQTQIETVLSQYDLLEATIHAAKHPVILVSNTCLNLTPTAHMALERTGLHLIAGLEHGIRALERLLWWSEQIRIRRELTQEDALSIQLSHSDLKGGIWSETQGRMLLQEAAIPIIPGELAASEDDAVRIACSLGFPIALKIQSAEIVHKSDVGGVILHLDNEDAVRQGFRTIMKQIALTCPGVKIDGVLVNPMRSGGAELLIGIVRDPLWGLVLTLGLGGIWTEALKDISTRVLPVQQNEIESMLSNLRGFALLRGDRGRTPVNLHAISAIIYRISILAQTLGPQLAALEINPLWINGSHIEALDILVSWQD
jgi:acyl-CoA synthetase (NDP forming)